MLPDSGGHLPHEISAFFILLTSIAMRMLRNLDDSIPLYRWIPTQPVAMLSDDGLNEYRYFCTLVLRVSIFKLLATECYRHANTSRPMSFNSPCRAEFNETLPDSAGHLPAKVAAFLSLLTCIALRTLQNPTLFNSPGQAESNALCPDALRPLVEGLSILLYFSSHGKYFQIVGYWVLQACGHFETYTIQFLSASGLQ